MAAQVPEISPAEACSGLADERLQLVDVREPDELAEAQVEGAVHIPLGELSARAGELATDRPVAFLCRTGSRRAMAPHAPVHAGFDAYNVEGGIVAWAHDGLPLTRG